MIAVDTNILVYAHRCDSDFHAAAADLVKSLAEGRSGWAIPWPCVHEFFAIATHPKIYDPPSTRDQAIDQLDAWLAAPTLTLLAEPAGYWKQLKALLANGKVVGPMVHDARIAALCAAHGVRELWSADRDFGRFSTAVAVRNPLVT
ncbi:type II toxin-antitoxin system VapC family toxin [Fodinicola acaciae]|uniref:type II toxin-antitoxin system VapC family toxin n=1 Tax=Fodinicola acaciae TaxID=2681555 RepID=UPI0013D74B62|nr:TA system VapC family ribonuclease toxin [Fodinicola acaciae]